MPTVLIVDDSRVDRRLAGGLLEKEEGIKVEYASNGEQALEKMTASVPDVVLTDLIMPKIDGLELVAQIRKRFPTVPAILMTSVGNEEVAVTALQKGAASYVPKHTLATELVETVMNVLEVARRERGYSRLMQYMISNDLTFELVNDRELVAPLVGYLQEGVSRLGICNATDEMRVGIALDEAITNALYHGNLEVSSELREQDGQAYHQVIEQRMAQPPYNSRRIYVRAILTSEDATFEIRDDGPGFDPSTLPDPTDPVNVERVSGRGILLMRTFMDVVKFNETGNCVTLIKRKCPDA